MHQIDNVPNLLDLLLDAVCVVNEDGVFLSASGAIERIFGYTVQEMVGRPMLDLVHPDDRERTIQAVGRLMKGQLQYDFENRYLRKDGSVVHLMWAARWYPEQGIRVAVARDISGRKQREAAQGKNTFSSEPPSLSLQQALELPQWQLKASPPQLVSPAGSVVRLSAQDYRVLRAITEPRRVVTRREIIQALGHDFLDYDQRRLDSQMRRLRRKVEQECGLELPVSTLRSVGYRFYEDIRVID
jgi:PAS domain S-box-containing protein